VLTSFLQATVHPVSADKDKTSVFKVKSINIRVDTLKFSIRDSIHDLFYNTIKPIAMRLVKKQIKNAIKGSITTGLEYVDGQLVGVRDRMASAKAAEGESRTEVLQEVNIMACALVLSHLLMIYTPDVHQEERRYVRTVRHLQCEALAVQSHIQQAGFNLGHWSSCRVGQSYHRARGHRSQRPGLTFRSVRCFLLLCLAVPYI